MRGGAGSLNPTVTYPELLKWIHLIAAGTWTGGLIVVGAVVPALREAGVTRDQLRAMARRFGAVSWGALLVAAVTGVLLVDEFGFPWSDQTLIAKLAPSVIALALAMGAPGYGAPLILRPFVAWSKG